MILINNENKAIFSPNDTKSARALKLALDSLLKTKKFTYITVNDLCQEAEVSRSSFYQNFHDKYDLMEKYLEDIFKYAINILEVSTEKEFISSLINFIYDNQAYLKNSFDFSDHELAQIHIGIIEKSLTDMALKENDQLDIESDLFKVRMRFLTGGLLSIEHYILDQRNKVDKNAIISFALEASKTLKSI